MSLLVVAIPARLASTRLANKPLLAIAGKPLLQHVIERAQRFIQTLPADLANAELVVATDDAKIAALAERLQVSVCMTDSQHATGSDRLAECAAQRGWPDDTIVLNLQGDEPLVPASCLLAVVRALQADSRASIATLCAPIQHMQDYLAHSCVKVVRRADGRALYFSRAPIPFARDAFAASAPLPPRDLPEALRPLRHVGLYAYRVRALRTLAQAPMASMERAESLEQLRALALGFEIVVADAPEAIPAGVDTPEDLARVQAILQSRAETAKPATAINITAQSAALPRSLLMVCMGNICRSPLSWAYAQKKAKSAGWAELDIQSRGTHAVKTRQGEGVAADLRAQAIARAAGLDLKLHRTSAISAKDFESFDLIIAHDQRNLDDLKAQCPPELHDKLRLLMQFAPASNQTEVPDPYQGDHEDFIRAWQLIKQGVDGLFKSQFGV